ncbi:MAG: lipopolysaccharide assembly protein LapA domain-containing protein [Candidatus Binatia bacterium]|jgi:uncharacterized integral membrane protein
MTTAGKAKLIAASVIVLLILIVVLENWEPVEFSFLFFYTIKVAKTLLILGSMLLGVVGTLVVQLFWRQRKRLREAQDSGLGT